MLVPRIINYTVRRNLSCSFSAVMLGVGGGLTEENLSGVLISRGSNNRYIALDAGSLLYGIRRFLIGVSIQTIY
jgi:3',5'-cyclic-nucleotide phosphodiesterase